MISATLDTSVYVRAFNFPGAAAALLGHAPDDNRVLECGVEAGSGYIVSKDKDRLRLGQYAGIRIVNVLDFMKIVVAPE